MPRARTGAAPRQSTTVGPQTPTVGSNRRAPGTYCRVTYCRAPGTYCRVTYCRAPGTYCRVTYCRAPGTYCRVAYCRVLGWCASIWYPCTRRGVPGHMLRGTDTSDEPLTQVTRLLVEEVHAPSSHRCLDSRSLFLSLSLSRSRSLAHTLSLALSLSLSLSRDKPTLKHHAFEPSRRRDGISPVGVE